MATHTQHHRIAEGGLRSYRREGMYLSMMLIIFCRRLGTHIRQQLLSFDTHILLGLKLAKKAPKRGPKKEKEEKEEEK